MSRTGNIGGTALQASLSEMLSQYLQRQADARAVGLSGNDGGGEVVPFEAVPVPPVDPRLAWDGALSAVGFFQPKGEAWSPDIPSDWPAVAAAQEPIHALAFAAGNFPQLVRDLHAILKATDVTALHPSTGGRPVPVPSLPDWAEQTFQRKNYPEALLALGVLRLARQFDAAERLIESYQDQVPGEWQPAWANEYAALAWHQGRSAEASSLWQSQEPSVPVLFNRGMSALFLGRRAPARSALAEAVKQLPEENAWHHLGRLYLALAEIRR